LKSKSIPLLSSFAQSETEEDPYPVLIREMPKLETGQATTLLENKLMRSVIGIENLVLSSYDYE
jgi:hypothetical protein